MEYFVQINHSQKQNVLFYAPYRTGVIFVVFNKHFRFPTSLPPSYDTWGDVMQDPQSTSSQKACAFKDYIFDIANDWTDRHLSSCKSYRANNHFGRRLRKWDEIYSKVFGCATSPASTTTTVALTTTTAPPTQTTTNAPEPECGCYAENEEIAIANDKCVLDLGTVPDLSSPWSLTFDLKINSLPDGPTDPRWFFYIISGIDFRLKFSLLISALSAMKDGSTDTGLKILTRKLIIKFS